MDDRALAQRGGGGRGGRVLNPLSSAHLEHGQVLPVVGVLMLLLSLALTVPLFFSLHVLGGNGCGVAWGSVWDITLLHCF